MGNAEEAFRLHDQKVSAVMKNKQADNGVLDMGATRLSGKRLNRCIGAGRIYSYIHGAKWFGKHPIYFVCLRKGLERPTFSKYRSKNSNPFIENYFDPSF